MDVNLAYKLWIDGEFAIEVGQVGTARETTVPNRQLRVIGIDPLAREVDIVLQVACFHHRLSGMADRVVLGTRDALVRKKGIISASILIVLGSLLIMAVYHLTIFLLRPKDLALLYFGIICLVFSLWQMALHPGERLLATLFPALTWTIFFQIEYLSLCLALPLIIMFLQALFPRESCKPALRIFQALSLAFVGLIIATPSRISVQTVPFYELIFFLGVVYVIVLLSKATRQKRVGGLFLLISMGVVLLIVINDILYHHRIIHTFFFGPWGVFILTGSYSFVLSMQFSKTFVTVDALSRELGRKK